MGEEDGGFLLSCAKGLWDGFMVLLEKTTPLSLLGLGFFGAALWLIF